MTTYAPKIFINYRRSDSEPTATRLARELEAKIGVDAIFIDQRQIEGGERWPPRIREEVERATAMLSLIGDDWLSPKIPDEPRSSRLFDADDWVRLEIERALERQIQILPLLVDGAELPKAGEIPREIAALLEYQAGQLRREHWRQDIDKLMRDLRLTPRPELISQGSFHTAFHAGPTRRQIQLYLKWLIGHMNLRNSAALHAAERAPAMESGKGQPAPRSEAFVDPGAEMKPEPTSELSADYPRHRGELLTQGLTKRIHPAVAEVTATLIGLESVSASTDLIGLQNRAVRSVLRTLRRTSRPIVLLGEPGSGKSTALRELAIQLARRALLFPRAPIPIYVELGYFRQPLGNAPRHVILDFVRSAMPPELAALRHQVGTGQTGRSFIILFDAMDEMPRAGDYARRTAALAAFADDFKLITRTIFACRTNDFDPGFGHRQLILKPFDQKRIRKYLKKSLGRRFIVEDRSQTPKKAARHLMRLDELGAEAGNPLTLSLAAAFIRLHRSWPRGRISLFQDHVAALASRALQRLREADGSARVLELVAAWARIAYAIFRRHGAVSIARGELEGEVDDEAIRLARSGGLLIEDQISGELRFRHHRLQEFLVAYRLRLPEAPRPDWAVALASPRWQETMLNFFALGGQDQQALAIVLGPLEELETYTSRREALVERVRTRLEQEEKELEEKEDEEKEYQEEKAAKEAEELAEEEKTGFEASGTRGIDSGPVDSKELGAGETDPRGDLHDADLEELARATRLEAARARLERSKRRLERIEKLTARRLPPERETRWSDQVHFAARLGTRLDDNGESQDDFRRLLRHGVEFLLERGRPPAQVRILSAWGSLASWCPPSLLDSVRASPVEWVRGQAINALVSTDLDSGQVDRAFSAELAWETLNLRLPATFSLFKERAPLRRGRWWKLAFASLVHLVHWLIVLASIAVTGILVLPVAAELWPLLGRLPGGLAFLVWVLGLGFVAVLTVPAFEWPLSLRLLAVQGILGGIGLMLAVLEANPAAGATGDEGWGAWQIFFAQSLAIGALVAPALVSALLLIALLGAADFLLRRSSRRRLAEPASNPNHDDLDDPRHLAHSFGFAKARRIAMVALGVGIAALGTASLSSPAGSFTLLIAFLALFAFLGFTLLGAIFEKLIEIWKENSRLSFAKRLGRSLWQAAQGASFIAFFLAALILLMAIPELVLELSGRVFNALLPDSLVQLIENSIAVLLIALAAGFILLLVLLYLIVAWGKTLAELVYLMRKRRRRRRVFLGNLGQWRAEFEEASEVKRRELLELFDHRAMGIEPRQALETLYGLERLIQDDQPVSSPFYRTMHSLQEAERQGRWTAPDTSDPPGA